MAAAKSFDNNFTINHLSITALAERNLQLHNPDALN